MTLVDASLWRELIQSLKRCFTSHVLDESRKYPAAAVRHALWKRALSLATRRKKKLMLV